MNELIVPAIAFLATILLIIVLRPMAVRIGLVDRPDARKAHEGAMPLVGGIAIFIALAIAVAISDILPSNTSAFGPKTGAFFAACFVLIFTGAMDDWRELSPIIRFTAQVVATLIMVFGAGIVVTDLGQLSPFGGELQLGVLAIPFTIFMTVGIINAINMCDGLDGLSGNMSLVSLAGLGFANSFWGGSDHLQLLNVVSAGVAGFLVFNQRMFWRSKASVFLGDAGSTMLGFALAWASIEISQNPGRVISPSATLWFLAIPIFDTVSMMLRRALKGRSPFHADAEHLHHMFVRSGFDVTGTISIMCGLAIFGVCIGLGGVYMGVPEYLLALAFLGVGIIYFRIIQSSWKCGRFLGRSL
jgi:UDP-GlcNAc:undecaprenyl-phosphate GlcNAc-1-phosphate transferase